MAATFVLKLGSLDLSAYTRVNPDDKMDPYSQSFLEPAFSETPFADTQVLVSTTVQNREQHWPLFLVDASRGKDQLHALVQQINNASAQRPLVLEWRDSGASFSTFFDVVFCRFEPDYNFRRSVHGYAAGVLHTWVAGYGHTGTTRIAATAAGTGMFLSLPVASVGGDAPALLDTTINAGANLPSLGRIVAVAPIAHPSYVPRIPAASLTDLVAGATLIGASGADGSQYLGMPVTLAGGASGVACKVPLPNPTIAGGDNRILAVVVGAVGGGVAVNAYDPYGNALGPTAVASNSQSWGLIDLGVCRLPTVGFPTLPKISIVAGAVWPSGAATPGSFASPNTFNVNEVFCLPDKNLTLLLESKVSASLISRDGFARYSQIDGQNDDIGNSWSEPINLQGSPAGQAPPAGLNESGGRLYISGATGTFDSAILPGIRSDSMLISAKAIGLTASLGDVRLIKDIAASQWVEARLSYSSQYLSLLSSQTNRASVALGSIAGQLLRLSLLVQGGQGLVNLSRDDGGALLVAGASSAFASVGASSAALSVAGAPGVGIGLGLQRFDVSLPTPDPQVSSWEVDTIPSSNLLAYDRYRIDGVNADSYRQSSAGVFGGQKLVGVQRGAFAKVQPSTSSVAVICAPFDQGAGNDLISAVVSVRERFVYAR